MSETFHDDDAYLNDLLDNLVTAEPRPAWGDVVRRARRAHRRYVTAAAALGALVLAPSGWALQHVAFSSPATISPPPPYQPGDKVLTVDSVNGPRVTTTINCNTINDAANLLEELTREGSSINDVECSNATLPAPPLPSAPAPYQPGDQVWTTAPPTASAP